MADGWRFGGIRDWRRANSPVAIVGAPDESVEALGELGSSDGSFSFPLPFTSVPEVVGTSISIGEVTGSRVAGGEVAASVTSCAILPISALACSTTWPKSLRASFKAFNCLFEQDFLHESKLGI